MNPREKRLLIATVVVAVLGLNYLVAMRLVSKNRRVKEDAHRIEMAVVEAESLLEQRDDWLQKSTWLDESQPLFSTVEAVETEILSSADTAQDHDLEILQKRFEPIENVGQSTRGSVSIKVRGEIKDVLAWLHHIQQPGQWQSVRKIRLEPGRDDISQLDCELTLDRWYRTAPTTAG